ncbi:hypothetical protein MLD52_14410 [Puniceicoccaceae bacterium K14]|nr:hypothetical protein [Puniceicoccaceae bacterium K14]
MKLKLKISRNQTVFSCALLLVTYLFCLFGFALFSVSCATFEEDLYSRPIGVEGATAIGSDQCLICHIDAMHSLESSAHGNLNFSHVEALGDRRCETCHGAGSLHMTSGGDPEKILNPKNDPEACFQCHKDKEARFNMPGAHPLLDGKVGCVDCHAFHEEKNVSDYRMREVPEDEACLKCHSEHAGPFVFEHEAMREGCANCHDPHGSHNEKMLRIRDANLCLQCHMTEIGTNSIAIGGQEHASFFQLVQGTCWTSSCHEAVHGSNASPKLRY